MNQVHTGRLAFRENALSSQDSQRRLERHVSRIWIGIFATMDRLMSLAVYLGLGMVWMVLGMRDICLNRRHEWD